MKNLRINRLRRDGEDLAFRVFALPFIDFADFELRLVSLDLAALAIVVPYIESLNGEGECGAKPHLVAVIHQNGDFDHF